MDPSIATSLSSVVDKYPPPPKAMSYGTAGFRDKADLPMHSIYARMGILACLRSISVGGAMVGVMITASHNPECDNGLKIVDSDGGMLSQSWEPYCEKLVNAPTLEAFLDIIQSELMQDQNISPESVASIKPRVCVGRDTRPHSAELAKCLKEGIKAFKGKIQDLGEVTTPQLHFVVQTLNASTTPLDSEQAKMVYAETLSKGFLHLLSPEKDMTIPIVVDASCGVGSLALKETLQYLNSVTISNTAGKDVRVSLQVDVRNAARSGPVNDDCGAELVQKGNKPPKNVDSEKDAGKMMCSYDGDADRIVFHGFTGTSEANGNGSSKPVWTLFDGDKIAALAAMLLKREMEAAGIENQFSMGAVQTAYANGASTNFFKKLGVPVALAKTGVKYLHHKALEFDVGIYFEANGHGTVLFSEKFKSCVEANSPKNASGCSSRKLLAFHRLKACLAVINQAVGDAVSDMLLCLAALKLLEMDFASWAALYTDLPSKTVKAPLLRRVITCSEDETQVVSPKPLQTALNQLVAEGAGGSASANMRRCFVRPSGTEEVVRIYAEASTVEQVDELIKDATMITEREVRKECIRIDAEEMQCNQMFCAACLIS